MLAEIAVQPQVGRGIRREVVEALEEIEQVRLRHEVEPFGTVVEGDLEQILGVLRRIHGRLAEDGIERFDLHVRLRQEPGEATLEREVEGFRERVGSDATAGVPGLA